MDWGECAKIFYGALVFGVFFLSSVCVMFFNIHILGAVL